MRRATAIVFAALSLSAFAAFNPPKYTNSFTRAGVTYGQFGGVKSSNYVATAVNENALVGGYTGVVKRAAYASVAAQSTNSLLAVSATNIITETGPMNHRALTNDVLRAARAMVNELENDLREGRKDVAFAGTANYALAAGTATAAESITDDSGQYYWSDITALTNGLMSGAALGSFAATGTVARATTYGTPTRWTDATGCVWEVVTSFSPWTMTYHIGWDDEQISDFVGPYWWQEGGPYPEMYDGAGWYLEPGATPTCLGRSETALALEYREGDWIAQWERELVTATNLVGRVALEGNMPYIATNANGEVVLDGQLSFVSVGSDGRTVLRAGSLSHGTNSTASGEYSYAGGDRATASGHAAHAEGIATHAQGDGSHASGVNTYASQRATFATGVSVSGTNSAAFVWSGIEASPRYGTHGKGSFNVDPIGGIAGMWVGNDALLSILYASLSSDEPHTATIEFDETAGTSVTTNFPPLREAVVGTIREHSLGGIWDSKLGVWWRPVMENGALRYVAATNVNLSAEGNQ